MSARYLMIRSGWQLASFHAQWRSDALTLAFDCAQPERGLTLTHVSLPTACEPQLFGLILPPRQESQDPSRLPLIACGSLLSATYDAAESFPVQTSVAWRVGAPSPQSSLTIVDAVFSIATERLNAQPRFSVRSVVPAVEVLTATEPLDTACWKSWMPSQEDPPHATESPLVLFRLPGETFSYLEIADPMDSRWCRLTGHGRAGVGLDRALFAATLEKGVILRSRLRGILLEQAEDLRCARAAYADFIRSEPPLGR
jgi:hypothetical protein